MKMLVVQRRENIRAMLLEKESITINEVMEKFNISVETARRDFDALAEEGFLNKIYGGATLKKRTSARPSKELRDVSFLEEKIRMANRAVRFMKPKDTIFLDNSDTVYHMCQGLMNMDITVLTNSLPVMNQLSKSSSIRLLSIGGRYDSNEEAFLGPNAEECLRNFQVDRAFFSCKSLDIDRGVGSSDEVLAHLKSTLVKCADQRCLLADHTKFGKASFARLCDIDDIDRIFTGELLSEEWKTYLAKHNVKVYECTKDGVIPEEENFY